jgi:hypothetical protein
VAARKMVVALTPTMPFGTSLLSSVDKLI